MTIRFLLVAALAALSVPEATAQGSCGTPAAVSAIVSPRNTPNSIRPQGLPQLGNASFALACDSPRTACVTGAAHAAWLVLGMPRATPLRIPGDSGCGRQPGDLLVDPALVLGMLPLSQNGPAVFRLPVPNDPALCGARVGAQALIGIFDPHSQDVLDLGQGLLLTLGI